MGWGGGGSVGGWGGGLGWVGGWVVCAWVGGLGEGGGMCVCVCGGGGYYLCCVIKVHVPDADDVIMLFFFSLSRLTMPNLVSVETFFIIKEFQ